MEKVRKFFVMVSIAMLLLPVVSIAGDLEPSGLPAPTMKSLDKIPPAWSQKLQCDLTACPRFELVLDGQAVLDKETGLVWEQSPGGGNINWYEAFRICTNRLPGGRRGWHLPTLEQIASLTDYWSGGNVRLPVGHPFSGVYAAGYWSATTHEEYNTQAWSINFNTANPSALPKTAGLYLWCVRGGQTYDGK